MRGAGARWCTVLPRVRAAAGGRTRGTPARNRADGRPRRLHHDFAETADPEQVKRLVDRCFERLVTDITTFGGRLDKIVGDEIVALFGAPVAHEDDAERAVRAALRMHETLAAVAEEIGVPVQHARRRQHRRGPGRRDARRRRLAP